MCIKIIGLNSEIKYDASQPLEKQVRGGDTILINYEAKDPDIDKFLEEMERLCKTGISCNINVDLIHNNQLKGAKAKRQLNRLRRDMELNEVTKLLVNIHATYDKTLEELYNFCNKVK